jgi:transcriptional regulator with XRE-family HTH domain
MDVEATRKARGLSRKQLAVMAGVTESTVWSVEHGKNPRGGEADRQAVLKALDPSAQPAETGASTSEQHASQGARPTYASRGGKKLAASAPPADWVITYQWNGILNGDPCRVAGETGAWTFKEHVVTGTGATHCTVVGNGKWRSFAPDRILPAVAKGKRKGPNEGGSDWTLEVTTPEGAVHTSTWDSYASAREQAKTEVVHGGKCRVLNHLGTEVERMGWTNELV